MKKGKGALTAVLLPVLTMLALPLAAGLGGMAATAAACTLPPTGGRPTDDHRFEIPLDPQGDQAYLVLNDDQKEIAALITAVGLSRNLPPRALVLATAAALAESELINDTTATRDGGSGLYGMRPDHWGTRDQVDDPVGATNLFYRAMTNIGDWQTRPLGEVLAEILHRPPTAEGKYSQWEQMAGRTVRDAVETFRPTARPQLPADCGTGTGDSGVALAAVPPEYRPWIIKSAAQCREEKAVLLAAQLFQESRFRPDRTNPRSGAAGIAQFIPATWATWGVDADGDGTTSPKDPPDGIMAAGRFMCHLIGKAKRSGLSSATPVQLALAGYNAGWGKVLKYGGIPPYTETRNYVREIEARARRWAAAAPSGPVTLPAGFRLPAGTPHQVRVAVAWALRQRGTPYVYGGSCTDPKKAPTPANCDCSSLVQQAYKQAGVSLPRTTFQQVHEGRPVPSGQIAAGDLLFTAGSGGSAARPGHVGMAIGGGLLVQAPRTGDVVKVSRVADWRRKLTSVRRVVG
ncbi:NlpC/P60 family protein [Actinomadura sp. CNU-125]|uniref:C40 family peptidase n=1 Tax=Actinomadura sp. CNU-125 TaxID=1904961 RepID=UPI0013017679|nr:bifunctional lytic transglycosylase/C40 family peptidase [Actinomadura sp. CNU-125]